LIALSNGEKVIMRLVTLCLALLVLVVIGCKKSNETKEFEANYKGTYIRTSGNPLADPIQSTITINFTKNTFSGSSNVPKYPALCKGSFTISQSKIDVINDCYFTADFDWSYIFKGEYSYEQSGNQLRIWRTYPDGSTDLYELTKED
jgi:hypothetical protein